MSSQGRRHEGSLGTLLMGTLMGVHEDSPGMTYSPPEGPAPNTNTLISTYKLGAGGDTQTVTAGNETSLGIKGQVSQKIRRKVV